MDVRQFFEGFPMSSPRLALAPTCPDYVEDIVLDTDTLARVAIPAGARFMLLSAEGHVRVKLGGPQSTFALPLAGSVDGSGSELDPAARRIPPTLGDGTTAPTHVLLRAPAACTGSLAFYA